MQLVLLQPLKSSENLWLNLDTDLHKTIIWPGETEVAVAGVFQKKVLLKILQNWQENTCVGVSFLTKFQTCCLQLY